MSDEIDLRKQRKVEAFNAATESTLIGVLNELKAQDTYTTNQSTTTVSASTSSVLLKAANSDRRQISITNTSIKTLWICFFNPATSNTPFFLNRDETWVFDRGKGIIYGIWDAGATGEAHITEENE